MIEHFRFARKTNYYELLEFVNKEFDYDFYHTKDNERFFPTDIKTLKEFLRASRFILTKKEKGDYTGLALLWKSSGGGKTRFYLKIKTKHEKDARDLLTALLWTTHKEIFVKIRKDSKYLNVLKSKGFRFCGSRGIQLLLNKGERKVTQNVGYIGKFGDDNPELD